MKALTFSLRLLEPVLATQPQSGEANSATSFSYIPGSMVRGAVIARYLDGRTMDAGDATAQRLFFSGTVCYLNAYPAHPTDGERMLPRPLSWFVEKDDVDNPSAKIYDRAVKAWDMDNPKLPRHPFVWRGLDAVQLGEVRMHVAVHTASDDRNRKEEGKSQVYRYEAIAAGEVLVGAIVADDERDLKLIEPLLEGAFVLGGSHTAGYGRVEIGDVRPHPVDWQEYSADQPSSGQVVVTLLSDAILRGESGQVGGDLVEPLGVTRPPKVAFRRMRLVGGFNRKWGLPLPQMWAVEAGSVFVYPEDAVDRTLLHKLVERGIGERVAEGFGRIAVDWHTQPTQAQDVFPKRGTPAIRTPNLSEESKSLARRMAARRVQVQLDRELVKQIGDLTSGPGAFQKLPSAAQLSRARLAARQAWMTGDLQVIIHHLDALKSASKEWDQARVRNAGLREWISQMVHLSEMDFKRQFNLSEGLPVVAGETAGMSPELWAELRAKTIARLIGGVLKQAVKHKKAEPGGRS